MSIDIVTEQLVLDRRLGLSRPGAVDHARRAWSRRWRRAELATRRGTFDDAA